VVLGLLAMFMMVVVSFVLSASADRTTTLATVKAEQLGDPYDALIKSALLQVARGPRSPNSVIGPHSLLEGVCGDREAVVGVVQRSTFAWQNNAPNVLPNANSGPSFGQIIELRGLIGLGPDRQPGIAYLDDSQPIATKGMVDDPYEA